MTIRISRDPIYRRRRSSAGTIEVCVRCYITYRLSYRDLAAMMAEREIAVSHTTVMRWVLRYVPEYERRWARFARRPGSSRRMDRGHMVQEGITEYDTSLNWDTSGYPCPERRPQQIPGTTRGLNLPRSTSRSSTSDSCPPAQYSPSGGWENQSSSNRISSRLHVTPGTLPYI